MPANPLDQKTGLDHAAAEFDDQRSRLFGIAYRMLGSAAEAEDVVQETWLRWQAADRDAVRSTPAFLTTVTTRLAINSAQSARSRHETYAGQWLPEPVDTSADPALGAERGEALELAILLLLEKLTPSERTAYVLREAFDYPYPQIAEIVATSESNVRQLVSRARKHIADGRRAPVDHAEQRRLLSAFLSAAQTGDLATLEGLLAADVVSYSDGGGVVRASKIPVIGRTHVSRFIATFATKFWTGASVTWVEANGWSSVVVTHDGVPSAVVSVSASAEGIDQVQWVMNPAKFAGTSSR